MQNTSATWKGLLAAGNARLEARAVIGGAEYTQMTAPVIARALTQGGLSVGNVVSASCQLAVLASGSIPRAATVAVQMRLTDGTTASEWLPAGTFFISHRSLDAVNGLLTLACYDALLKANAVWEPSAGSWPRNMSDVAAELRGLLGIPMDSRTAIPVGGLYVMDRPNAGATIRDVLGQIGQACGGNWIVTPANALRLVPVVSAADAAGATGNVIDVAGVTGSVSVGGTGTVTGIRNTWEDVTDLVGTEDGLVLETQLTPVLAAELGENVLRATYQAYELGGAVYDPAAELGDYVRAGANGEVSAVLYAETATLGPAFRGSLSAPEAGEMSDEYPYIGASQKALSLAKAYAKEAAADAVDGLDGELTQQEIFNRLTDNGAAQGLILYNGRLYINASYINTGELVADIIKGGTLTLGGANNVNGTLVVLDASGNVVGSWDNAGITAVNGKLTLPYTNGEIFIGDPTSEGLPGPLYITYTDTSVVPPITRQMYWFFDCLKFSNEDNSNTLELSEKQVSIYVDPAEIGSVSVHNRGGGGATMYSNGLITSTDTNGNSTEIWPTHINTGSMGLDTPLGVDSGGTGASTAVAALQNLKAFGAGSLPSTVTDLDDTSLYGSRMLNANDVSNMPPVGSGTVYFFVVCMGSLQIAAQYGGNNGVPALYARQYTNSQWYPWTLVGVNLTGKSVAQYIQLSGSDWASLYETLSGLAGGEVANAYFSQAAAGVLTGGKLTTALSGTVMRSTNAGLYRFWGRTSTGVNMYAWNISGLTSATSTPTVDTVYRFAGTAI